MLEFYDNGYMKYWDGKYLRFIDMGPVGPKAKTRLYEVRNKYNSILGSIRWFGSWRKYTFFAKPETVYDERCLMEVAEFLTERSKEHKIQFPKNEKIVREQRKKLYEKNRLTKEAKCSTLENERTVVQPNNGLVEGGQVTLTPLEVELGTISF